MNISPIFDFSRFIENQYFWNTETNLINGSWWTGEQITNDIITVHTKYPLVRPPQQNYSGVKELSVRDWTHRFMVNVFKWWRRTGVCVAVLILFRIHWNQLPFVYYWRLRPCISALYKACIYTQTYLWPSQTSHQQRARFSEKQKNEDSHFRSGVDQRRGHLCSQGGWTPSSCPASITVGGCGRGALCACAH